MADHDETKSESEDEKECESSEDSEEEIIDMVEFQKRLETNYRKVILSELQFSKVKTVLKDIKLKQLAVKKREVEEGKSRDLVNRNLEAYNAHELDKKMAKTMKGLELDSLERKIIGQRKISENDQDDNAILIKEKILERLLTEKTCLEQDLISARTIGEHILKEPETKKIRQETVLNGTQPYPLIVYELKEEEKEADLEAIEVGKLAAKIRNEHLRS